MKSLGSTEVSSVSGGFDFAGAASTYAAPAAYAYMGASTVALVSTGVPLIQMMGVMTNAVCFFVAAELNSIRVPEGSTHS